MGLFVLVAGVVIVVSGLLAMGVRGMVEAPQRQQRREAALREQTPSEPGSKVPATPES